MSLLPGYPNSLHGGEKQGFHHVDLLTGATIMGKMDISSCWLLTVLLASHVSRRNRPDLGAQRKGGGGG